jgi:hypothetical protein
MPQTKSKIESNKLLERGGEGVLKNLDDEEGEH